MSSFTINGTISSDVTWEKPGKQSKESLLDIILTMEVNVLDADHSFSTEIVDLKIISQKKQNVPNKWEL